MIGEKGGYKPTKKDRMSWILTDIKRGLIDLRNKLTYEVKSFPYHLRVWLHWNLHWHDWKSHSKGKWCHFCGVRSELTYKNW